MKRIIVLLGFFVSLLVKAQESVVSFNMPDSVKAVYFLADIEVKSTPQKKEGYGGIREDLVKLYLETDKSDREIVFEFPKNASVLAKGMNVSDKEKGELTWNYPWSNNETYKLLIACVGDSAENFTLYSGYVWLPKESAWKLLGTCKVNGQNSTIKDPALISSNGNKNKLTMSASQAWVLRSAGGWKNLGAIPFPNPVVSVSNHVDSLAQLEYERGYIKKAITEGRSVALTEKEGIYYAIENPGSGRQVLLTDTVTVHYKGYLFTNNEVFDQTTDKPATFPLKRLIKGWQIAIPMVKVGGKLKIVIPSALAYSIRTRAAKIPPNSILVFDIEVLDAKPGQ